MRLKDRVALVTGGASGIGLATAERLLEEGAVVAIADLDGEAGERAIAYLQGEGHQSVELAVCDVADAVAVADLVAGVVARHGRIDILFNNAGFFTPNEVHELDEEEWARTLAVNLTSVFLVSRQVVPGMLEQGGGTIVNNSSVAAIVGDAGAAAYCATKGAVGQLTKAMALDYARRGIRVNSICCGEIDTPLFEREAEQRGQTVAEFRAENDEAHPIGRMGLPREAADAVVYLASDEASFITGVLLPVDGGYSAG